MSGMYEKFTPVINRDDLTTAEYAFIENIVGLSYQIGDILYYNGSNLTVLHPSVNGYVLTLSGGLPAWVANSGGSGTLTASFVTMSADSSLTSERILTEGEGLDVDDTGPGSQVVIHAQKSATLVVGPSSLAGSGAFDYQTSGSGDQTQINAAIAALPSDGGRVLLREGTYTLSAKILINKSNVTLEGQGAGTKITLANTVDQNVVEIGTGAGSFSNIQVRNCLIDGNMANQTNGSATGIYVYGDVTGYLIEGNVVQNTDGANIYCDGKRGLVVHNYCSTTKVSSFWSNIEGGGDYTEVIGNICTGGDLHAIDLYTGNYMKILDNVCFTPTRDTIEINAEGGVVSRNYVTTNVGWSAIAIDSAFNIVSNNFVNMTAGSVLGIQTGSSASITVTGNSIYCISTTNGAICIDARSNGGVVSANDIYINTSSGDTLVGIYLGNNGMTLMGNTVNANGSRNKIGIDDGSGANSIFANSLTDNGSGTTIGIRTGGISGEILSNNVINYFDTGIQLSGTSSDVLILGNILNNLSGTGVDQTVASTCYGITITANNFIACGGEAIDLGSTTSANKAHDITITANTFTDIRKESIKFTNVGYSSISSNTIFNSGLLTNNTYAAILLQIGGATGHCIYNTIQGNIIRATAANKHKYGIREEDANQGPNIITGNIALNAATAQISTQHVSTDVSHNLTV